MKILKVKSLIIHHSATSKDFDTDKSIQSFNTNHKLRLHKEKNGFGMHLAYHYIIGGEGKVINTRPANEAGWHASNYWVNLNSLGICLIGNFDLEKPNAEQVYALRDLLRRLCAKYNLKKENIHLHSEYAKKTCPGKHLKKEFIQSLV
jgi:N-acetyl-anhydromuramyl-L-alanine amidase AmpD